jgi:hypothetical protein
MDSVCTWVLPIKAIDKANYVTPSASSMELGESADVFRRSVDQGNIDGQLRYEPV